MSAVEPPFLAGLRQEFERVTEADAAAGCPAPRRRSRLRDLRLRVALPALTAFALLAAIAVVATGAVSLSIDLGGSDPTPMSATNDRVSPGFGEGLVAHVSVLGRARTDGDAIDPSLTAQLPPTWQLDRSLRVMPPPDADPAAAADLAIWLVPAGADELAIVTWVNGMSEVNGSVQVDLSRLEWGGATANVDEQIFGVVPDGVEQITLADGHGETVIPVRDNVFIGQIEGRFHGVTWEGMTRP